MNLKMSLITVTVLTVSVPAAGARAQAQPPRTSGVYLTVADYENGRLELEGDCRSKAHKVNVHDFSHKPYIDVKHDSEQHRYSKSNLYGFRACDAHDYRFASKFEYQILEAKDLFIYGRDIVVNQGRTNRTVREYYFSVGPNGQVQALTLENLKQAFPDNHRFHDWLDATFGAGQDLGEYDQFHKTFKVNRLLIASLDTAADNLCCPKRSKQRR